MTSANAWLALAGGIVVVAGGFAAIIRWLRHHLGGLADFMTDWHGEPARPGVAERPGVMARLSTIEGRLGEVEHELKPNSGQSLRDAVNRIDRATGQLSTPQR